MPRRLVTLAVGTGVLLTAAACQKPSPSVTVVSNGSTIHFEAQQWCRDGKTLTTGQECPGTGPAASDVQVVRAANGGQIGIDVDPELTDHGWYVYDSDTNDVVLGISDTHYRTFYADFSRGKLPGVENLEIRTVDHVPTSSSDLPKVTGRWSFQVVAKLV